MKEIAGRMYHAVVGSDLDRDGMYLELQDSSAKLVAEVFYSDGDGSMTFTGHQSELPLELIEWMIGHARERLVPTAGSRN